MLQFVSKKYGDLHLETTPNELVKSYSLDVIGGSMPDVSDTLYVFVKQNEM